MARPTGTLISCPRYLFAHLSCISLGEKSEKRKKQMWIVINIIFHGLFIHYHSNVSSLLITEYRMALRSAEDGMTYTKQHLKSQHKCYHFCENEHSEL